jgi:hypothetical protein
MGPRPEQVKPTAAAEHIPLEVRLEEARKNERYWHEQIKKAQINQVSDTRYDYYTERAQEKIHEVEQYEKKFERLLDDPIIIDPEEEAKRMIILKGVSRHTSDEIVSNTGLYELGSRILRFYSEMTDPRRTFKIETKTETTLRELFDKFKAFLNSQFTIPRPTKEQMEETQNVVNEAWENYREAQKKVKELEEKQTG